MRSLLALLSSFLLFGCSVKPPKDIHPITNFDLSRYLGTWYEVARIDNRFEKGLTQASANYTSRTDGGIRVLNKGWDPNKKKWKEAVGKGYFVENPSIGALKVSFFGPFYGGYNIIKLDEDYHYALVVGSNKNYLWILSRTPTMPSDKLKEYVQLAKQAGFDTQRIIFFQ
ncbi:Bacterial lipocalin Blc (Blc) (PDB:1QWD) [Commensalibacter communis]|uniref:lipocalin family protein n=1 Tax=Commensalibacter communis TaxID=2972786 RepID=UPI0022FF95B5|nr:lipocalin family protein [Commensalibacter communis]CAI3937246.1 Bacterial lipocalin Blc (Blc) (PDB:1QWD) [Commensalibacter communis]